MAKREKDRAATPQAELALALQGWLQLNDFLRSCSEEDAAKLLEMEKAGKRRPQHLIRIHARMSVLRGRREKTQLLSGS